MKFIISFCGPLLICALPVFSYSQKVLPLDKAVKTGKLPNGFTYYIRHNEEPKNRAQLYLVVKAGSILENENQRGLAHFMEHMSFNGTKHFPKNELVEYLQKSGVRFGADLNAYTSFDETVYQLPIPTDDKELFDNGMQIMRDWAQDASLDTGEINNERGVVLEEKRLHKGADNRVMELTLPVEVNHSRYAQRLPIGIDTVLKNFQKPAILSFYKDWYRPDLQALIVVGDINENAVEEQIKKLFGDLKKPTNQKSRTKYAIPLTGKNQFKAVTDAEFQQTILTVMIKYKSSELKTDLDYRRAIMHSLFSMMLSARLDELSKKGTPEFLQLQGGYGGFMGGLDALSIELIAKNGKLKQGFQQAWTELARIKKSGFTGSELLRMKDAYANSFESALKEKDKRNSVNLVGEYQRLFLNGEASPGIEAEYDLVNKFLPGISLQQINTMAALLLKNTDRDIIIMAPATVKAGLPDDKTVNSWITQIEKQKLTAYTEKVNSNSLLQSAPVAGKVIKENVIAEIAVTEWTLSNGARVVIKPTDFKNDEIYFAAFSPGGASLYGDDDYQSAANAAGIVERSGLGTHDAVELSKLLTGKLVQVSPFIADRFEGVNGAASKKDIQTALELLQLYFTSPGKDTAIFNTIITGSKEFIANRYKEPNNVFTDTVNAVLGNYSVRRTGPSLDKLKQIDLDKLLEIYKQRFSNAGDFSFVFVGSFNPDTLKPLVEKYIGSLPATGTHEQAKDLGIHIPAGQISKTVRKGKEDKATVRMVISGYYQNTPVTNMQLEALQEILEYHLITRLRESEAGVYSPSVRASRSKYPAQRYSITISFGCAPANVEKLIADTKEEIRKLKITGISDIDLQKFKSEEQRQMELQQKENKYWLNYLAGQYQDDDDVKEILSEPGLLNSLNGEDLKKAAGLFFNDDNFIRFVLLPE